MVERITTYSWVAGEKIKKFKIKNEGGGQNHVAYAILIDGKTLIDAGAQWDQSQVWSDGASAPAEGSLSGVQPH